LSDIIEPICNHRDRLESERYRDRAPLQKCVTLLSAQDDTEHRWGKDWKNGHDRLNVMIKASIASPDGLDAAEIKRLAEWAHKPSPGHLLRLAKRRGMQLATFDPRPNSREPRYRFFI
jgi:hypothetical protein